MNDLVRLLGISRRTVFRDLKELQELGLCRRYDATSGGYSLDAEASLPPMDLEQEEALGLLLSQQTGCKLPSSYRRSADVAALKIQTKLSDPVRSYCNRALEAVSSRSYPETKTQQFDEVFEKLQQAIVACRRIRMTYWLSSEGGEISLELNPYRLHFDHPRWYLFARTVKGRPLKVFKLSRVRDVALLPKTFVRDRHVDPAEALGRAWSMQPEGRLFHVKLRFSAEVAEAVLEVQWHRTQQVERQPDGSAVVEFRVDGLREITWWILSYGDQVEVLAPQALRQRVLGMAKNIVKAHEKNTKA